MGVLNDPNDLPRGVTPNSGLYIQEVLMPPPPASFAIFSAPDSDRRQTEGAECMFSLSPLGGAAAAAGGTAAPSALPLPVSLALGCLFVFSNDNGGS